MQLLVKPLNNILSVFKEFYILKSDLVLFSIWKAEPEDLEWAGGTNHTMMLRSSAHKYAISAFKIPVCKRINTVLNRDWFILNRTVKH